MDKINSNDIKKITESLLLKLIDGTLISDTNDAIQVVTHLDVDGIIRLYFHTQNTDMNEIQQECYGRLNKHGMVEVYKLHKSETNDKEYSNKQTNIIDEINKTIKEELTSIEKENEDWNNKSSINKFFSRISGKKPSTEEEIKEFILKLPEHLKEIDETVTFVDSIKINSEDFKELDEQTSNKSSKSRKNTSKEEKQL